MGSNSASKVKSLPKAKSQTTGTSGLRSVVTTLSGKSQVTGGSFGKGPNAIIKTSIGGNV